VDSSVEKGGRDVGPRICSRKEGALDLDELKYALQSESGEREFVT
jgi:hypothetical protein